MKTKPVFIRRLLVLVVTVLLGVLCGAIVGSGTAFFYPVFAMPLLGAFGVGMGMSKAIHWCRVSRPWVATLLATVGTLVLMSTALMMGYAIQRAGIVQEIEATHRSALALQAEPTVNDHGLIGHGRIEASTQSVKLLVNQRTLDRGQASQRSRTENPSGIPVTTCVAKRLMGSFSDHPHTKKNRQSPLPQTRRSK